MRAEPLRSLPFWWRIARPHLAPRDGPDPFEDATVAAVRAFAEEAGVTALQIRDLSDDDDQVTDGQLLTLAEAQTAVRLLLRQRLWCLLESPGDDFAVHVDEPDVHIGAVVPCVAAPAATARGSLVVVPGHVSPYLPRPDERPLRRKRRRPAGESAWEDVQGVAADLQRLRTLPPDEAAAVADAVAARYVADHRTTAWWSALRPDVPTREITLLEATEAWSTTIEEILPPRDAYVLIPLDDVTGPAGAIEGPFQALAGAMFLTYDVDWVITTRAAGFAFFSTPHDRLVLAQP